MNRNMKLFLLFNIPILFYENERFFFSGSKRKLHKVYPNGRTNIPGLKIVDKKGSNVNV